ncbi:NAD-glutamate dehydrogenase [Micrococcales bacterium 31B]|nr:NAD-glutamate dehydrogenase [Micrococcales bacterium 31B]
MLELEGLGHERGAHVINHLSDLPDWQRDPQLVEAYFRFEARERLSHWSDAELAGGIRDHLQLAATRQPNESPVRVEQVGSTGRLRATLVSADMPFVVDSIVGLLDAHGARIDSLWHPILNVQRDGDGNLTGLNASTGRRGETAESWVRVEFDTARADWQDPADYERGLTQVLADVAIAVADYPLMLAKAKEVAASIFDTVPDDLHDEARQARELLNWLAADRFTFLGYREYTLADDGNGNVIGSLGLTGVSGTGLGVLRESHRGAPSGADRETTTKGLRLLPARAAERATERKVLVLTKANRRSTVHRRAYLDYVGIKTFDASGQVIGERRFLGLFTLEAYTVDVTEMPVVREVVEDVLRRLGRTGDSHEGADLVAIMQTYPRDELLQLSAAELAPIALSVMHLSQRRQPRVFLREDPYQRFITALVYLPRDRYNTTVRESVAEILRNATRADSIEYTTQVGDSALARLHFVLRFDSGNVPGAVDEDSIQRDVVDATRTYGERLVSHAESEQLLARPEWAALAALPGVTSTVLDAALPAAYLSRANVATAAEDLSRLMTLADSTPGADVRVALTRPDAAGPGTLSAKVYSLRPIVLARVIPAFAHLGLVVTEENPFTISLPGAPRYIYEFTLELTREIPADEGVLDQLSASLHAAMVGWAESDVLSGLTLTCGLDWRQVAVIRAYSAYLQQSGWAYSRSYVHEAVLSNPAVVLALWDLFEARFQPGAADQGGTGASEIPDATVARDRLAATIDAVTSLDHDRILRGFAQCITATLRTNAYRRVLRPLVRGAAADPAAVADSVPWPSDIGPAVISFKLDPHQIDGLPQPVPYRETWVYSSDVEGSHLRFGAVARGGLRWSDRNEDFRTEVLGLVKAQVVKNAVIVPTGAKGAFIGKSLPSPAQRDAWRAAGTNAYRSYIRGLLDLADNLVHEGGATVVKHPELVRRHDADDTYFVVAADKGTATFSDVANEISADYGFWLADAFASGGSHGYDHKAMGITAKGAWESVKRHFLRLGQDVLRDPFTAVGIGDMSGDVFGNGMMLSPALKLVAAFDHRDIFIDPSPQDREASLAERVRLFNTPGSSWQDYERTLISRGGGVFSRTAKSIDLNDDIRGALGLDPSVGSLAPTELVRAILRAPVDLLWNGGIGTYVKASTESDAEIGDKANDSLRVNGSELRARVVGEGGNLGFSQRGRIEAAAAGVLLNTDAIDNSAGVDTSDHEVNIKIALEHALTTGAIKPEERDDLLESMTDEVGRRVLRHNYTQNVLLANAAAQRGALTSVHRRLLTWLEQHASLNRALEFLPTDAELEQREAEGSGLTAPEFSVVIAYTKTSLHHAIATSDVVDEPWAERWLFDYFPPALVERARPSIAEHPLRKEIIANRIANHIVDECGVSFVFRAWEETGASLETIVRSWAVMRAVFDLEQYYADIYELDGVVTASVFSTVLLKARRLMDRSVRWLCLASSGVIDVDADIATLAPTLRGCRESVATSLRGPERQAATARIEAAIADAIPAALASRHATLVEEFALLDVALAARDLAQPAEFVRDVYFELSARFAVDPILNAVVDLPRDTRWEALARGAIRDDAYSVLDALGRSVLHLRVDHEGGPGTPAKAAKGGTRASGPSQATAGFDPEAWIDAWSEPLRTLVDRAHAITAEVLTDAEATKRVELAAVGVAVRSIREVARAAQRLAGNRKE